MKTCTKCRVEKPLDQFYKDPAGRLGRKPSCAACSRARIAAYKREFPELHRAHARLAIVRRKADIIAAYGGACKCCGETTPGFLSIDHIYNDGAAHRREIRCNGGSRLYDWLKQQGYPKDRYQLLCLNCNTAKGHYGDCPHESFSLIGMLRDLEAAS